MGRVLDINIEIQTLRMMKVKHKYLKVLQSQNGTSPTLTPTCFSGICHLKFPFQILNFFIG